MKKQIGINDIKNNPNNPRIIKDNKFKKLVKSIKDFPEMLEKRPIVVDENMIILGGNMRLKACLEAGLKEVWIDVAEGWTEDQKQEFIVKDNVGFGEWDWDTLANEWDIEMLEDWGLDVLQFEESYDEEKLSENDNFFEKNEVVINLSMPYYEYEKMEDDFQNFIKKYPNIICKIQN
ncbi:MAG: ParB N-terminal domain-containing protein [Lutibacter sp.]|nr:ParB N-terminal domain-containing protein [Lutibacter sp.]